jgi:hypothetical protein
MSVSAITTMLIGCADCLTASTAGAGSSAGFGGESVSPSFASGWRAPPLSADRRECALDDAGHLGGENIALVVRLELGEEAGDIG